MKTKYQYYILLLKNGEYHASMSKKVSNDLVKQGKAQLLGKTFDYSRKEAIAKVLGTKDFKLAKLREVHESL